MDTENSATSTLGMGLEPIVSQGTVNASALCSQIDPDLWYSQEPDDVAQTKGICNTCPAVLECLEVALNTEEEYGVWGGTTPAERWRMLRRRR